MKLKELKQKIDNFFNNLSEEERVKLKEKYFFQEYDTPKGWGSIEESLPTLGAQDLIDNKVKEEINGK